MIGFAMEWKASKRFSSSIYRWSCPGAGHSISLPPQRWLSRWIETPSPYLFRALANELKSIVGSAEDYEGQREAALWWRDGQEAVGSALQVIFWFPLVSNDEGGEDNSEDEGDNDDNDDADAADEDKCELVSKVCLSEMVLVQSSNGVICTGWRPNQLSLCKLGFLSSYRICHVWSNDLDGWTSTRWNSK